MKPIVAIAVAATIGWGCSDVTGPADAESIEAWMEFHGVPGVSVAVIKDFEVSYLEQYGVMSRSSSTPVDENTRFQAASLSKSLSAATVLTLVEDGTVSLDADIDGYLESWQLPWSVPRGPEVVTLRRLLSHTAGTTVWGFRGYRRPEPVPSLIDVLDGRQPANSLPVTVATTPGSEFQYSGGGYEVMEQAVLDITDSSFPALAQARVLEPLGMRRSTYQQPAPDSLESFLSSGYYSDGTAVPGGHHIYPEIAAAGLWATPEDLARFVVELQLTLRGEGSGMLSRESVEMMLTEVMSDYGLGSRQCTGPSDLGGRAPGRCLRPAPRREIIPGRPTASASPLRQAPLP